MKRYLVEIMVTGTVFTEVEASSMEEAESIVDEKVEYKLFNLDNVIANNINGWSIEERKKGRD